MADNLMKMLLGLIFGALFLNAAVGLAPVTSCDRQNED